MSDEYSQGYMDGRDKNCPEPNNNRDPRYIHSFRVGRAEIENNPIPYHVSMRNVEIIEKQMREDGIIP